MGHHADKFASAYTWMLLMLFELYYIGFGQAIAAFSPNEVLASLLVPVFFLFVVSFCGVVVPFNALPYVSLHRSILNAFELIRQSAVLAILDVLPDSISVPSRRLP